MIKITKANGEDATCNCCKNKYDLYDVTFGHNENRTTTITLCPVCRKQLSSMIIKRVK